MGRKLRVGSLVYATDQGLGVLARAFVSNGIITDPYIVRHPRHETHDGWYPSAPQTLIKPFDKRSVQEWVRGLDVLLCLETPFDWMLLPFAKSKGIKTILMTMYECTPEQLPCVPDVFFCPSLLDLQYFVDRGSENVKAVAPFTEPCYGRQGSIAYFTPVPVSVPWTQRTAARVFVHNAGHGSFRDRNGTEKIVEALRYITTPARLRFRFQNREQMERLMTRAAQLMPTSGGASYDWTFGTHPYYDLWNSGDVYLFPESFNGLSLPLQEARAAGMLVMAADRFPMNTWLPKPPLVPVRSFARAKIGGPYNHFEEAQISPADIAAKIDEYYDEDIIQYSKDGHGWAQTMSWDTLGPKYRTLLEYLADR